MSIDWESVWTWLKDNRRIVLIIVGLVALFLAVSFTIDRCSKWRANRDIQKKKDAIVTKIEEIKNINANIQADKVAAAAKAAEVNADIEQLHKDIYGLDDAKTVSNAAVANFQKAVQTNTNVNVTADDLENKLKELEAH